MACSTVFIEFVCELLAPLGEIRARKMMGDYIIYLNEKNIASACDNNLYVKMYPQLEELLKGAEIGKPYQGAKDHYILDETNPTLIRKAISLILEILPEPKRK